MSKDIVLKFIRKRHVLVKKDKKITLKPYYKRHVLLVKGDNRADNQR